MKFLHSRRVDTRLYSPTGHSCQFNVSALEQSSRAETNWQEWPVGEYSLVSTRLWCRKPSFVQRHFISMNPIRRHRLINPLTFQTPTFLCAGEDKEASDQLWLVLLNVKKQLHGRKWCSVRHCIRVVLIMEIPKCVLDFLLYLYTYARLVCDSMILLILVCPKAQERETSYDHPRIANQ